MPDFHHLTKISIITYKQIRNTPTFQAGSISLVLYTLAEEILDSSGTDIQVRDLASSKANLTTQAGKSPRRPSALWRNGLAIGQSLFSVKQLRAKTAFGWVSRIAWCITCISLDKLLMDYECP